MSKIIRGKVKDAHRVPVDKDKWGANCNTYEIAPMYYYDIEFVCCDCGSKELWLASQQKWWYEEASGHISSTAKRCRKCRAYMKAQKEEQKRHMEEMALQEPSTN